MLWLGGPLVGPAKIHGNVELAEHAARQLLALDPDSSSWYVLLSYIYATIGMPNKEWDIREINEDKVWLRTQGIQLVEVDKYIYLNCRREIKPTDGRNTHWIVAQAAGKNERDRICTLTWALHFLTVITTTSYKHALCHNSESTFAGGFGLISALLGSPLHIFENLQVCNNNQI